MITLDIGTAIFLYLMFSLCAILVLWVSFERGGSFEKYTVEHKEVWLCEYCTYTYVDSTHDTISRCPQCDSYNKKEVKG